MDVTVDSPPDAVLYEIIVTVDAGETGLVLQEALAVDTSVT